MASLISYITNLCSQALSQAFPELTDLSPEVTPSTKEHFGHYQCNEAMKLAKILKQNPRDIAQSIINKLPSDPFEKIEIAGAGFINLTLSKTFLENQLNLFPDQLYPKPSSIKKIIVEYSSPNIAKDMHVGHLRSTIIGDCLAKVFSYLGHDVLTLNHIGDWGTAFGMLTAYLQEHPEHTFTNVEDLTLLYKKAHEIFANDPQFKTQARQNVVLLQAGDPVIINLWKKICEVSEAAFNKIYNLLNIQILKRGESFYNDLLPVVVEELEAKNLVTLSEGAKCVFHDDLPIPLMIQKSDGGYNYDTTDIAAMKYRIEQDKAQQIIIVTDSGQSLHFKLVEATALAAGYLPHKNIFYHVPFGLVLDAQGKKFKTRSGENVKLIDLLETAIHTAEANLKERISDISSEELENKSKILGINAIKYADLSSHRTSDYIFSFEKMLRFEGNTALFILYAFVRIQGIKRRLKISSLSYDSYSHLEEPSEKALALTLLQFPEIVDNVAKELCPHILTDYLYQLTNKFNAFFRDCHIEGSDHYSSRLYLLALTEKVLELGMSMLGLQTMDSL